MTGREKLTVIANSFAATALYFFLVSLPLL